MYCTHGAATEIISWQIVESKLYTTIFSKKKKVAYNQDQISFTQMQ